MFAGHFVIQSFEMLGHLFLSSLWILVVSNVVGRRMNTGVEKIDPDACLSPPELIRGQKADGRIFFFQIFIDDGRLVNHAVTIDQHRNLGIRIQFEKILRFVFEIHFNELVGELLF